MKQSGKSAAFSGPCCATLQAGEFFTGAGGGVRITTSQPTQAYIVTLGELLGSDPTTILLAGATSGLAAATVSALATDNANTLAVSMPTAAIPTFRVDGAPVLAVWLPYVSGGSSHTTILLTPGPHRITAGQPFLPIVYGEKLYESYGYVPGSSYAAGTCTSDVDGDGVVDTFDRDADGDSVNDVDEANGIDLNRDGRADGLTDATGVPLSAGGGLTVPNSDGDGVIDSLDPDSDDDGVTDGVDGSRTNPNVCRDQDSDTCDDCAVTGANRSGGSVANDGPDFDGDGRCNAGDPDDDNDGALDPVDSDDANPNVCSDNDGDGCDDCSSGSFSPSNDGPDNDSDGQCNACDLDDDNDDVLDAVDANASDSASC